MTDTERAEVYYRALETVLAKLETHSAETETTGRMKAYLIGYINGIFGTVKQKRELK